HLLHAGQVHHDRWTDFFAVGVHKVNYHHLVLHQVIIETHFLASVGDELNIAQVPHANELTRRDVSKVPFRRAFALDILPDQAAAEAERHRSYSGRCQPLSSRHLRHNLCSFFRVLFCIAAEPWPGHGFWLLSITPGCTCHSSNIAWSSWMVLWQCVG